jgi:hypothetical protein
MRLRPLAIVAALAFGSFSVAVLPAPTLAQSEALLLTTEELMRATALDEIFTQFGPVIEAAPQEQSVPFPSAMAAVWGEAARNVFVADDMHQALAQTLEGRFSDKDNAAFAEFFRSPFGEMISRIERDVTLLGPESQEVAREEGLKLAAAADPRRDAQIEEMLRLVSADLATAMVSESVRGMMIGMAMTERRGDIVVPWEEIDAHIQAILPAIQADVAQTQRAMMFYAYRDLSEAELERYLDFLRTEAAQKFYAVSAFAVGEIVAERMRTFGETLVAMLRRVNV